MLLQKYEASSMHHNQHIEVPLNLCKNFTGLQRVR